MKKVLMGLAIFATLIYLIPFTVFFFPSIPAGLPVKTTELGGQIQKEPEPITQKQEPAKEGFFRILDTSSGNLTIVPVLDYVIGAVAAEMPMSYSDEALKAQAIAAHTYALAQKENQQKPQHILEAQADFEADPTRRLGYITKDVMKALWKENFDVYYQRLVSLVTPIINDVITYEGKAILACYHAFSNGSTQPAQDVWGTPVPYLTAIASVWDEQNPEFTQTFTMTAQEMKDSLTSHFAGIDASGEPQTWFGVFEKNEQGYVKSVKIGGVSCKAQDVRTALGLRSTDFSIIWKEDHFEITSRGYGHGVGMSQFGAEMMAQSGKTAQEILDYYYPQTQITNKIA